MKYFVYVIFSIVEYSSLFILILALFRFKIMEYIKEIILTSTICAILTFTLKYFHLNNISMFIQIACVMFLFKSIFKEKALKTLWIIVSGYAIFVVIEAVILFVINYYKLLDVTNIDIYSFNARCIQLTSIIISNLVSLFIRRTNDGFSFSFHKKIFSSSKILFISVSLSILIGLSFLFYMYSEHHGSYLYFEIITVIAIISLIIIIFLSNQQQKIQFGDNKIVVKIKFTELVYNFFNKIRG